MIKENSIRILNYVDMLENNDLYNNENKSLESDSHYSKIKWALPPIAKFRAATISRLYLTLSEFNSVYRFVVNIKHR